MDTILLWTIFMIFVTALVGMVVRYRTLDKCLKGLDGYFVIVEWANGNTVWGELGVYHNAIELVFPSPHVDPGGAPTKTSYIIYKAQFKDIHSVRRLHGELSHEKQEEREEEIRRTYRPNLYRRSLRRMRNLFNLLRDALGQAFGAFVGQAKKTAESTLLQTQDARLTDTATKLLTAAPAAYEPILENYIGHRVVLEIERDGAVQEVCGILREYTGEFICVLDVPLVEDYRVDLDDRDSLKAHRDVQISVERPAEGTMTVSLSNRGATTVQVERAQAEGFRQDISQSVEPAESAHFELGGLPAPAEPGALPPPVTLVVHARRLADLVVPRTRGMIRHGSEEIATGRIKML